MQFDNLRASRKRLSGRGFALRKNSRSHAFAAAVLTLNVAAAVPAGAQQAQPAGGPVGTVYAERQSISNIRDFVGRVDTINRVEAGTRVQVVLEEELVRRPSYG